MGLKQCLKNFIYRKTYKYSYNTIFMFHHVTDHPSYELSGCKLSTDKFEKFVTLLASNAGICSLSALLKNFNEKNKRIAITFDDGLMDTFDLAYPILKFYNIPFTVFVLSDFVGQEGYLTWKQLQELDTDPLVTIGIHGSKHNILTNINEQQLDDEITNSKALIENHIGRRCDLFAFSHGQYNSRVLEKISASGYKYSFAVKGRSIFIFDRSRYTIPRVSIESCNVDFWLKIIKTL